MRPSPTTWAAVLALTTSALAGPPKTAVEAYMAAAALCATPCVSEGVDDTLDIDHPPYPAKWLDTMRAVRVKNTAGLAMIRQAGRLPAGTWDVPEDPQATQWPQLNASRHLASQLADAAVLAQVEGRPGAALDLLDDMADLVQTVRATPHDPGGDLRALVGLGIDAYRSTRLVQLAPYLTLADRAGEGTVTPRRVRAIIHDLLDQHTPAEQMEEFGEFSTPTPMVYVPPPTPEKAEQMCTESMHRMNAERTLAAMSLACQLFRFEHAAWPDDVKQLVQQYLPTLPVDPWGDGKQTFAYRVIARGLPDGGDRPLVFDRCVCGSKRWLTDARQPLYGWNNRDGVAFDGTGRTPGQFRDVAAWPAKP